MSSPLKIGDPAPVFTAIAVGGKYGKGKSVSLQDFKNQTVILYFYPKDNTPGCTTQACSLRDHWKQFENKVELFGISIDSVPSHEKFINQFNLPFPLLTDESKALVHAYEVWVEKSMYGKKYWGTERSTFVIDPDQKIKAIFRKIKPGEQVKALLAVI